MLLKGWLASSSYSPVIISPYLYRVHTGLCIEVQGEAFRMADALALYPSVYQIPREDNYFIDAPGAV